jgi:hypothetical protein
MHWCCAWTRSRRFRRSAARRCCPCRPDNWSGARVIIRGAAFDIATGSVLGKCYRRHRSVEFLGFLKKVDGAVQLISTSHWCWIITEPTKQHWFPSGCRKVTLSCAPQKIPSSSFQILHIQRLRFGRRLTSQLVQNIKADQLKEIVATGGANTVHFVRFEGTCLLREPCNYFAVTSQALGRRSGEFLPRDW